MTILASGWLLALAALLTSIQPEGSSGQYQLVAEPSASFLLLVGESDVLLALLGGAVAGRLSLSAPGANGATAAAFGALAGISWLLLAVLPFSTLPPTVSVEADTLAFWAVVSLAFYLLALLAGYLGGRLGGRLRRPPKEKLREPGERRARVARG